MGGDTGTGQHRRAIPGCPGITARSTCVPEELCQPIGGEEMDYVACAMCVINDACALTVLKRVVRG